MDGETLSLNRSQRKTAERILDRIAGSIECPEDVVDDWECIDESFDYQEIRKYIYENVDHDIPRQRDFVPVSKIAGSISSDFKVMQNRLKSILNILISNKYTIYPENPPKLEKVGSRYYVSTDGHHRVIAFKALGLDKMCVEYIKTPLPED